MTIKNYVDKLTSNQRRVHAYLRKHVSASYEEVAQGTKLNKGSVQRAIMALMKKDKLTRNPPVWVTYAL